MHLFQKRGQGLVEYLILTCLIAVSAIWVVSSVGKNITEQYGNISRALTKGDGSSVQRTEADEASYQGRGMGDYMQGSRKQGEPGGH
jgi:pilus assembly protein Flp/PilA